MTRMSHDIEGAVDVSGLLDRKEVDEDERGADERFASSSSGNICGRKTVVNIFFNS